MISDKTIIITDTRIIEYFTDAESLTNFIFMYMKIHDSLKLKATVSNDPNECLINGISGCIDSINNTKVSLQDDISRCIRLVNENPLHNKVNECVKSLHDINEKLYGRNSNDLGRVGEMIIDTMLIELFPTFEFQKREQGCDFILTSPEYTFAVEVKNYTKPVPLPEIEKFNRDIRTLQCDGIFISKGGICGKENFAFENIEGCFVIYVIGYEKPYIAAAYSLLRHISRDTQCVKQFTEDDITKIVEDYNALELAKQIIMKNANSIIQATERIGFLSLTSLVEDKVIDPLKCLICDKTYKAASGLRKHMKNVHLQ